MPWDSVSVTEWGQKKSNQGKPTSRLARSQCCAYLEAAPDIEQPVRGMRSRAAGLEQPVSPISSELGHLPFGLLISRSYVRRSARRTTVKC
jgi:hypothetical protein